VTGKVHGRARQASGGSAAGNNNAAQCTQPPGGQALHLASRASRLTRIRFPWLACLACLVEFLLHRDLDAVTRTCTHTPCLPLKHSRINTHINIYPPLILETIFLCIRYSCAYAMHRSKSPDRISSRQVAEGASGVCGAAAASSGAASQGVQGSCRQGSLLPRHAHTHYFPHNTCRARTHILASHAYTAPALHEHALLITLGFLC
jgi:hypothetical protein